MKQIITILLLLLLLTSSMQTVYAGTLQDLQLSRNVAEYECNKMNIQCNIIIDTKDNTINAHTYKGYNIYVSAEMVRNYNQWELLAVVLHEIGHIKNKDIELLDDIKCKYPELLTDPNFRHSMEYEADNYATKYFGDHCLPNYTVDIFYKLGKDLTRQSATHPTLQSRINNAQRVYKNECTIK